MNLADGYSLMLEAAIEASRPDPELRCDEWAEQYMVLPRVARSLVHSDLIAAIRPGVCIKCCLPPIQPSAWWLRWPPRCSRLRRL